MHELLVIIWFAVALAFAIVVLIFLLACVGIIAVKGAREVRKAWRSDDL